MSHINLFCNYPTLQQFLRPVHQQLRSVHHSFFHVTIFIIDRKRGFVSLCWSRCSHSSWFSQNLPILFDAASIEKIKKKELPATKQPVSTGSCVSGSPSSGIEFCWIKKCRNSDFFLFSINKSLENRHKSQFLYSIFDLMVIEWQSFVLNSIASIWNMMQSTVYCLLSWWAVLSSKDLSSLLFSSRRLSSSWFSFR